MTIKLNFTFYVFIKINFHKKSHLYPEATQSNHEYDVYEY